MEAIRARRALPSCSPAAGWPVVLADAFADSLWCGNTTISFGPSDCPENMAGAGVLLLVTAPVIANIRLYHVLIDGGAGLNVISYAALNQL